MACCQDFLVSRRRCCRRLYLHPQKSFELGFPPDIFVMISTRFAFYDAFRAIFVSFTLFFSKRIALVAVFFFLWSLSLVIMATRFSMEDSYPLSFAEFQSFSSIAFAPNPESVAVNMFMSSNALYASIQYFRKSIQVFSTTVFLIQSVYSRLKKPVRPIAIFPIWTIWGSVNGSLASLARSW